MYSNTVFCFEEDYMGLRTPQRRAFEELRPKGDDPIYICPGHLYFLDRKEIFFVGVSEGIGTCADLKGVNIAVFTTHKPSEEQRQEYAVLLRSQLRICQFSVLRREPTDDELQRIKESEGPNTLILVGEGLLVVNNRSGVFNFVRNSKKSVYVNIVT